jgi:hypothetical protein
MKTTEAQCAAEQGIAEEDGLGMEAKSKEFVEIHVTRPRL